MKKIDKNPFGTRIKEYESLSETYLDKTQYTIIRVDGHGFSKFTKGFEKPFDDLLTKLLSETARALMAEFKAVTAYSQSDEITLLLLPDENLIYSGRVQKITSLVASFASMKFNDLVREEWHKMNRLFVCEFGQEPAHSKRQNFLKSKIGKAFFDARVFQVPTDTEAFNSLLWRTKDCERNSKNVFAQNILSHKDCQNLSSNELVEKCLELGYNWNTLEDRFKYGILWKKENYIKKIEFTEDGRNYLTGSCIRTRFINISKKMDFSDDNVTLVLTKKL